MPWRRVPAAALLVAGALGLPAAVAAQAPVTTAPPVASVPSTPPLTTAPPVPTTAPAAPTSVPAPGAPTTEATIAVGDEVAYRAALATLSAAPTGLHTIVLTADITVDDGTDPTYTGTRDLTVDGRGFTLDAVGEPLPGSPLIDAIEAEYGSPSIAGGCARFLQLEGVDQRGLERPTDGDGVARLTYAPGVGPTFVAADCDIGAVEARTFVPPSTGPVPGAPPFTG